MQKYAVQIALEGVKEARTKWAAAQTKFIADLDTVMFRLLHEAARNFMSDRDVSRISGIPVKQVRLRMRKIGLDPSQGKTVLSDKAAEALTTNAALMGIDPHDMDLTSPLAYLPMGEELKRSLQDQTISKVTEFPETTCSACGK